MRASHARSQKPLACAVRWGSRLCENSDVGLARRKSVSITLNKKRTALAVTVERRKERIQFCAFSARARFHTAWVILLDLACPHFDSADGIAAGAYRVVGSF